MGRGKKPPTVTRTQVYPAEDRVNVSTKYEPNWTFYGSKSMLADSEQKIIWIWNINNFHVMLHWTARLLLTHPVWISEAIFRQQTYKISPLLPWQHSLYCSEVCHTLFLFQETYLHSYLLMYWRFDSFALFSILHCTNNRKPADGKPSS